MLIEAYPAGTRTRDDHEQILPLHLAAKWGASEAILLAIMTTHPEGALFRDAEGKTPLDHAEKIPTALVKEQVTKTLKLAPIMCSVSKAAKLRATAENESRLKGMAEAHANHIQLAEVKLRQELVETKEAVKDLRAKLAAANSHAKICNDRLEAVQRWVKSLGASMDSWSVGSADGTNA
jgi:phosphopantetheinyl transferase (holo-ACP synthase)